MFESRNLRIISSMGPFGPQENHAPASHEPLPPCNGLGLERAQQVITQLLTVLQTSQRHMNDDWRMRQLDDED
jgi:hypothetical protein